VELETPTIGTQQPTTCGTASECSPFASRTVTRHLARGAAGLFLLIWALANLASEPAMAALAGVGGVVALRGCPMCWTVGLVETVTHRIRRRG
jgi:hypothetical protein